MSTLLSNNMLNALLGENVISLKKTTDADYSGQLEHHYYYSIGAFHSQNNHLEVFAVRAKAIFNTQRYISKIPNSTTEKIYRHVEKDNYHKDGNAIQVTVNHQRKLVTFGPKGNILVLHEERKSLGLGSYLMSRVIRWVKERYPSYRVCDGVLGSGDGDPDNAARRDRFYRKHGFSPVYPPECITSMRAGSFGAETVSHLHEAIDPKKVIEHSIADITQHNVTLFDESERLSDLAEHVKSLYKPDADKWQHYQYWKSKMLFRLGFVCVGGAGLAMIYYQIM